MIGNGKGTKNRGRGVTLYVCHMSCYLSILFSTKLSQIMFVYVLLHYLSLIREWMMRLHFACAVDGERTRANHHYFLVRVNVHCQCTSFDLVVCVLWVPMSNLMLCFDAMISYFHLLNIVPHSLCDCQCTSFDLVVYVLWVPTSNLMLCFDAMISYFHLLNIVPHSLCYVIVFLA